MAPEAILSYQGMSKRYGQLTAVDGLDLLVDQGGMLGLIGPDGAGKTTTLRVGLGLLKPDAGSVRTCGLTPHRQRRRLADRVGYLSQRFSLYGDLSVDENVAFFAKIHGVRGWQERRDQLLDLVRLTPFRSRLADRLSGGMKQKLALACTLIHRPQLLVLDEPTTGVDPVSRRDFWRLLSRLQRDGLTIVMTTPYLDEAERCRRVGLMHHGRLLAIGEPQSLRRSHEQQAATTLLEVLVQPHKSAVDVLQPEASVAQVELFGERLHVTVNEPDSEAAASWVADRLRRQGLTVQSCRPIAPSLEDVFIAQVRAAEAAAASDDQQEVA
jgi:ABC-2 type transport system ATP-binding protein